MSQTDTIPIKPPAEVKQGETMSSQPVESPLPSEGVEPNEEQTKEKEKKEKPPKPLLMTCAPPPYSWRLTTGAKMHYIVDTTTADRMIPTLEGPIGFDIEWKPQFKKDGKQNPVALVQLSDERTILLIQVSQMARSGLPITLRTILENPQVIKAGVGIREDAHKMLRDFKAPMRACADLSIFATQVDYAHWKATRPGQTIGLATLAETYLKKSVEKKSKIRMGNWEAVPLPAAMLEYAANDAHLGLTLFHKLTQVQRECGIIIDPGVFTVDVTEVPPPRIKRQPKPTENNQQAGVEPILQVKDIVGEFRASSQDLAAAQQLGNGFAKMAQMGYNHSDNNRLGRGRGRGSGAPQPVRDG
jgi:hypothetical protein